MIKVKTLTGKQIEIDIEGKDTIEHIKERCVPGGAGEGGLGTLAAAPALAVPCGRGLRAA